MPNPKKAGDEFRMDGANLILCTQADLCDAQYALYLAEEDEKDEQKKAALHRVGDALHQLINHFGVDGIGNFDLLKEYEVIK
jgi:hypothetical protein